MPQITISSTPLSRGNLQPLIAVSLFSYGHSHGPLHPSSYGGNCTKLLAYNIRHLPNPPRKLRAMTTGLSPRLQKEFIKGQSVEDLLCKVQKDLVSATREGVDAFLHNIDRLSLPNKDDKEEAQIRSKFYAKSGNDGGDYRNTTSPSTPTEVLNSPPDIFLVLAVCCEEGRHRSVAFIEEMARRIAELKNGDGEAYTWRTTVHVSHRDLDAGVSIAGSAGDDLESAEQPFTKRNSESGRGKTARKCGFKVNKRAILGTDDDNC